VHWLLTLKQFGLKNFDMVVVFKDFNRSPQHINTVPMETIDQVRDWLDSVEIPFYEGALNLQWATIMKTVMGDPYQFYEDGGWHFLSNDSDSEDGGEESEEESAFEAESEDFNEDESSGAESDFDENASEDADVDEDLSDVSEAPSWDELEKSAARKDREANVESEDDKKVRKRKR
jgi:nucleosome binding factor SPN SPT16 subunit